MWNARLFIVPTDGYLSEKLSVFQIAFKYKQIGRKPCHFKVWNCLKCIQWAFTEQYYRQAISLDPANPDRTNDLIKAVSGYKNNWKTSVRLIRMWVISLLHKIIESHDILACSQPPGDWICLVLLFWYSSSNRKVRFAELLLSYRHL